MTRRKRRKKTKEKRRTRSSRGGSCAIEVWEEGKGDGMAQTR